MVKKNSVLKSLFSEFDKNFIYSLYKNNTQRAIILSVILLLLQIYYMFIFDEKALRNYILAMIVFIIVNIIILLVVNYRLKTFSTMLYRRYMFGYLFLVVGEAVYFSAKLQQSYNTVMPAIITIVLAVGLVQLVPIHMSIIMLFANIIFFYYVPVYDRTKGDIKITLSTFFILTVAALWVSFVVLLAELKSYKTLKTFRDRSFILSQMSIKDSLTGLFNHKYGIERIEEEISRRNRTNTDLALLLFDVDNFKGINDNFGHTTGDAVLKYIGHVLKTSIRKTDVAIRYGGDEFMIIFPYTKVENVVKVCEKLTSKFNDYHLPDGRIIHISGGLAQHDMEKTQEFINKADAYLYKSKEHGKNRITYDGGSLRGLP